MAQRPKEKPKRKSQKNTDKEQSERFKDAARTVEADETGRKFDKAMEVLIPAKRPAR